MFKKSKKFLSRLLLFVISLLLIGFGAYTYGTHKGKEAAHPPISTKLISTQLQESAELTSSRYLYSNMGEFENHKTFYGWQVPFTQKHFVVAYDGVIHAGVNLRKVEVDVDPQQKIVTITLPKAQILSHEIDQNSIKVFDESQSIFNPIELKDYTGFAKDQKADMEEKAIQKGLLTKAKKDAIKAVKNLLHFNQTIANDYTLRIQ